MFPSKANDITSVTPLSRILFQIQKKWVWWKGMGIFKDVLYERKLFSIVKL